MVNVILTLRIVQAVLAIIVLGLACYVVDFYNHDRIRVSVDAANFLVFNVCVFSPLVTFSPRPSRSVRRGFGNEGLVPCMRLTTHNAQVHLDVPRLRVSRGYTNVLSEFPQSLGSSWG